jgi:hypothetical protein
MVNDLENKIAARQCGKQMDYTKRSVCLMKSMHFINQ